MGDDCRVEPSDPDPFLVKYKPSELRIASEFLATWLPFLSRDLCDHCAQKLSDRVRSLDSGTDPTHSLLYFDLAELYVEVLQVFFFFSLA